MYKIESIQILKNPNFVKPVLINYTHRSVLKKWEAVLTHDSVAVLLWHKEKDAFILVKQLRPTVLNKNPQNGMMYELCAGIVDKEKSLEEIAKEEVLEECGYDIPLSSLYKISSFYTSVGISGNYQTIYYAECSEDMRLDAGGGVEEEEIEVVFVPVKESKAFMFDEEYQKTTGVLMAFYWFFDAFKRTL